MKTSPIRLLHKRVANQLAPATCAFLATLLALPVNAGITLPTDPLTTASRVPPNILFILDDSGSMEWRYMYNPDITSISGGGISSQATGDNTSSNSSYGTTSTSNSAIYDQNYVTNTLYYNPKIDYQPWLDSTGTPLTVGTSYDRAESDDVYVTNTAAGTISGVTNLSNNTQTFYVPKANATSLSDATQYYRYQIRSGTTGRIVQSERLQYSSETTTVTETLANNVGASTNNYAPSGTTSYTFTLPANASNLTIFTDGGTCNSGQCANLYVRRENHPTTSNTNNGCSSASNGNVESCSPSSTSAGSTYYVRLYARTAFSGVRIRYSYQLTTNNNGTEDVGCDTSTSGWGWRNCVYLTPLNGAGARRTEDNEKINFATWYSYYRTRTKAAKGGAATAFNDLGNDVRVGFRTIHGRNGSDTTDNSPTQTVPIPVYFNQGLFDNPNGIGGTNNNRARWYNRLFSATANSGTPLRTALNAAGLYFSNADSAGPYGPEAGSDQLACRQNFTILTTDGYWNDSFNSVGNQDGADGEEIQGPGGRSYTYEHGRPYTDSASNTLADVAMKYWKTDLRGGDGGLDNIVPSTNANPAFWQHMVTFGISIGLKGTLDPNTSLPGITAGTVSWPTPSSNNLRTIDDLYHASVNGHGRFLAASNPSEFATGLRAALATVTERTGSFSNVAANSSSLETDTLLFKASYVSGVWTGELSAYARQDGGEFAAEATWNASQGIPASNRRVFSSNGTEGLVFPSEATSTQLAALTRTGTNNFPVSGADNAAYLAGTRNLEMNHTGGTLRIRNHLLGDIVTSSPAYVKDTNTLYVGANDGMLHAIDASNGAELFGFIPNGINWTNLGSLSRPDYGHRYFVDGPIVVSNRQQTPDANILVGALGKGGKGLFALDVSNPESFDSDHFKWEVTGDDDAATTTDNNVGLVQGKPFIAKLNNDVTAVIVGNGINSTNGRAVLQIYNLDTGELIRELDTGVGSAVTDHADSNGLSAPVGWNRDGNDTYDYVYAGDMLGNVWKFDLTSDSPSSWGVANSGSPLFTATNGTVRQPITGGMTVAMHPTTYKTWVFFGTGRFLTSGDVSSEAVQAIYGVIDSGTTVAKSALTARAIELVEQDGQRFRAFEQHGNLPNTSSGWYVNLTEPAPTGAIGERIVTSPQMDGSVLEFSSIIPTADACQPDGRGYVNALDAFTGTSTRTPYFDADGDGQFSDDTLGGGGGDGEPPARSIGSVDLGVGMVTQATMFSGTPGKVCAAGSSGSMGCVDKDEFRNVGRVSWREVIRN
ncbi:PilC/PilY family type IV pilus protein [Pseudoxanthomonas sp. z9]|uniref:PilC/PilY family type IV pilus protein n=1 Tax=Pseudoxanthomonas sp. z9 TaxID=2584942 RepID=UPI00201DBFD5|nr:PilC/PilY family type IV pilus protein [Pseudoxanthomonas sp. z9]MCL6714000.1 PilC/PilY family type IV pilus protein [Pseudomonas sp. R2.Fl]